VEKLIKHRPGVPRALAGAAGGGGRGLLLRAAFHEAAEQKKANREKGDRGQRPSHRDDPPSAHLRVGTAVWDLFFSVSFDFDFLKVSANADGGK